MRLRLNDVHRTFAGPPPVAAVRGVSLELGPGEFVALTGPSGSGKSSLLNLIGLLDCPDRGRCEIDGVDTAALPESARDRLRGSRIGFVFQQSHVLPNRTVLANVGLGLRTLGSSSAAATEAARRVLDQVGLAHRAHARAGDLSGGERQRAGIARALVAEPGLVLADEPTGNLDVANSLAVLDLLRGLPGADRTVMVVTHDARVAAIADRVLTLVDGRLV